MFNSLKRKDLVRVVGQRRAFKFTPAKSGRTELPASDEADLNAISNAKRRGVPIYFLRTNCGSTLDVLLDKPKAIKTRDAVRDRMGRQDIHLYERQSSAFIRVP